MSIESEYGARVLLTPEQWVGLINRDGPHLPICGGNVSAARDALIDTLRNDSVMTKANAMKIIKIASNHGPLDEVFHPGSTGTDGKWATAPGSPWPAIVYAVHALIPEEFVESRLKMRRRVANLKHT